MKLNVFILALGLIFSTSGFATAQGTVPDTNRDHQHHKMHKDWHVQMLEREQKLLSWVEQYTPEKKSEWTQAIEEKKELRKQWKKPENAKKREQWKKEKLEKMQNLKKLLEEGKITKEQFMKEIHGGKYMAHWKKFRDLQTAIENKDDKQAKDILNQLLDHYKAHNAKMKEMLAE
ncbi:hypothetical protein [Neobacillus kokaensis]|uniref:Uncharacterized protein n=1 Tax=Neobacillus kokaensis TaxID=2759023 RepID=A0ABQ3MX12_9BACI|nr:hypothetical protein [Neobacillus kokaensis]GHH96789.1 hypothetical protein AM1BK_03320 [Neobacillus kokaensis]